MTTTPVRSLDSAVSRAVDELSGIISTAYPHVRFKVRPHPEEPSTTVLEATVDVDDLDTVLNLVFERMEQLRFEEGVPILVVPLHSAERVAVMLAGSATTPISPPQR